MNGRERRARGRARLVGLHEDDGRFDRDFWRELAPHERLEAAWGLVRDYLELRGAHGGESRLQRSVCRVERRRG